MRPIYVIFQNGVSEYQQKAVLNGIRIVLDEVQVNVSVKPFGVWRHRNWLLPNGELASHMSVDWYVKVGQEKSQKPGQLHAGAISNVLLDDPWQRGEPHWDVTVFRTDLYDEGCNFVLGEARFNHQCLVSVHRFLDFPAEVQFECIATTVAHELGHVFGLVHKNRKEGTIEESLGSHCTNRCIMRQRLSAPGWIELSRDRLQYGPFCQTCLGELYQFFR